MIFYFFFTFMILFSKLHVSPANKFVKPDLFADAKP